MKRLKLENTSGGFWSDFFPEIGVFLKKVDVARYRGRFFDEVEKGLRMIRIASLKIDSATDSMIHKVKKSGTNGEREVVEEIPERNFKEEEEKLITAISEEPKNCVLYTKLGDLYLEMKSFDDAAEAFRVCLELDPKDKEAVKKLEKVKTALASPEEDFMV